MMHVMTVEAHNDSELAMLKGFVERSGLRVRETHTETILSEAEELETAQACCWELGRR